MGRHDRAATQDVPVRTSLGFWSRCKSRYTLLLCLLLHNARQRSGSSSLPITTSQYVEAGGQLQISFAMARYEVEVEASGSAQVSQIVKDTRKRYENLSRVVSGLVRLIHVPVHCFDAMLCCVRGNRSRLKRSAFRSISPKCGGSSDRTPSDITR